ncbi:HAMP domain-containing histidine kinase [Nonomuraea sp. K274]|uniref:histidine kinase n=1 Tax=Nonomuraea cypriaca TaxID=1187855 RepID=A0A931F3E9_9ACTN|nr:HAMP domain-containing sensor histidine kinase [Nonomuraea cypriaca]MBF8189698.1 HAMP domain-containing histidine kinase [Nonomuraea cypriaca]
MIAAVVFTVTSTIGLIVMPANLYGEVNARVELAVREVARDARMGRLPPVLDVPWRVQLIQVVSEDGQVLGSTRALRGFPRLSSFRPAKPEIIYSDEHTLPHSRDKGEYLVMAMRTHTPDAPVIVYGAGSLRDVNRTLIWLRAVVFLGTPVMLLIVGGTTWIVAGLALRPVERIRSELAEITLQDLSRRVPEPGTGDEISDLAATTNHTLDRLQRSAETQRRFVADASHELRSPITALRTQLEVANACPDETDWRETGAHALAAADRLTNITNELLMLARLDAGAAVPRSVVEMCRLAEDQVRRRQDCRVPICLNECPPAPVFGTLTQLDRLLTNLLDNATRHARSKIDLDVAVKVDRVVITVTDDGEGIAPEDRERVFERFTRLKAARDKEKGGTGLGLPLSREIAMAHGGTLTIADHRPGARFVVDLPLYGAS